MTMPSATESFNRLMQHNAWLRELKAPVRKAVLVESWQVGGIRRARWACELGSLTSAIQATGTRKAWCIEFALDDGQRDVRTGFEETWKMAAEAVDAEIRYVIVLWHVIRQRVKLARTVTSIVRA